MKLLGCVLTIVCTGGIGFRYVAFLQKRVKELRWFLRFLVALREELTYSRASVEHLLQKLSQRKELRQEPFLEVFQRLDIPDIPFPLRWCKAVKMCNWKMNQEEQEMVSSVSEILGAYDITNQLDALNMLEHRTKENIKEAEEKREHYRKISPTLGTLSGIALCIMLL